MPLGDQSWGEYAKSTFYKCQSKYDGMDTSLMARMKALEEENRRLKKCILKKSLKLKWYRRHYKKSGKALSKTVTRTKGLETL